MPRLKTTLVLATLALAAVPLAPTVRAEPPSSQPQQDEPSALAREAIDKLMRALSLVIENLPQYAMPEINERGDIIIRRLNPRAEQPPRHPDTPEGTRT